MVESSPSPVVKEPDVISVFRAAVLLHRAGLITLRTSAPSVYGGEATVPFIGPGDDMEEVSHLHCDWVSIHRFVKLLNYELG